MKTVDENATAGTADAAIPPGTPSAFEGKGHLRQFQAHLSERLRHAESAPRTARLGMSIGGRRWLVDLAEAGEIVPVPATITPVPLTVDWFRGLVNLRGALFAVSDLRRFAGGVYTPINRESRLLAFSAALDLNAALLVSRMLGLQDPKDWAETDSPEGSEANLGSSDEPIGSVASDLIPEDAPWVGRRWIDPDGQSWRELRLSALAEDERFLSASL